MAKVSLEVDVGKTFGRKPQAELRYEGVTVVRPTVAEAKAALVEYVAAAVRAEREPLRVFAHNGKVAIARDRGDGTWTVELYRPHPDGGMRMVGGGSSSGYPKDKAEAWAQEWLAASE